MPKKGQDSYNSYNSAEIEKKWQEKWQELRLFSIDSPKFAKRKKTYVLVELTYSSGDLHIGHWFAWTAPDVYARFKRMQGYNVLFPVGGFDSFGLPAENAAIKQGIHPADWTEKNINNMRRQFISLGPSFDWDKEVITSDPSYYKWTQWLFLKFYKAGLAYRAKALSNWCPICKTVLANEHVVNGCCWRHTDTPVVQKEVEQWFLKITSFADRLIWPEHPNVEWPKSITEGHNNWIGRKEGITIRYKIQDTGYRVECWTSRPDTNFGATFIVLAPEHPLATKIATKKQLPKVKKYIKEAQKKSALQRLAEGREKTGIFTGVYAVNDLNGEKMPVWVSDFVLMDVGTGAVVGVPGHDRRDFEFAKKFKLPIKRVVVGPDGDTSPITRVEQVQEEEGTMVNSGFLDGSSIHKAITKIMAHIEKKGWGKRETTYHLRDWSISRQRYWGAPIPIIYCKKCGTVPVPEKDLPVTLPYEVDYTPTGRPPLATAEEWVRVACPQCGAAARREVETMDTYVDSSWYFLRYPSTRSARSGQVPFDPEITKKWLPLGIYFGGSEHILGHTLYARFVTKFLHDQGYLEFDEFAKKRVNHGVILGPDGYRMSKSRGNVVNPDEQVKKYGADSVRLYLCFMGPHRQGAPWSQEGIEGTHRFLRRVWRLCQESKSKIKNKKSKSSEREIQRVMHKTIKKVTEDIENLRFNTAVAALMEFVNELGKWKSGSFLRNGENGKWKISREALETLVLLLAPFAPHMAEELWQRLKVSKAGKVPNVPKAFDTSDTFDTFGTSSWSVHLQPWPKYDPELAQEETVEIPVQVDGRLRATVSLPRDEASKQHSVETAAKKVSGAARHLKGKKVKKVIFVPGRLINFVV